MKRFIVTSVMATMVSVCSALELCPTFSPEAVKEWKTKADAGDAESQFLYAWHLMGGLEMRGLLPDFMIESCSTSSQTVSSGLMYAEMAVKQGYGAANMLLLASAYERYYSLLSNVRDKESYETNKEQIKEQIKEAGQRIESANRLHKAWVDTVADNGNPIVQFQLGIRWLLGLESKSNDKRDNSLSDPEKAEKRAIGNLLGGLPLIYKSAKHNYAPAKMYLSRFFELLFAKCSECSDREFEDMKRKIFSKLHGFSIETKSDFIRLSAEFAKSAAEQGLPQAMQTMGYMCDDMVVGKMTEGRIFCPMAALDYSKALEWYRKAEKAGCDCKSAIRDIEATPKTFMGIEFGADLEEFVHQRKGTFHGKDMSGQRVIGRIDSLPKFRMFDGNNWNDGRLEGCPESRKIYGLIRQSSSIPYQEIDAQFERTCEAFKKKYGQTLIDLGWPENDEYVDVPRLGGFVGRARSYKVGKMRINIRYCYYKLETGDMVMHVYHEGYRKLSEYERLERMAKMGDGADVL